ncbi:MAG: hypothetical protein VYB38_11705 [Bacteroidota bacterium]|nr:hypothetical protein [Bacteroidota bacterium]MEE3148899.1 hypothetical protein [Bacteroidota bacterium]
MKKLSLYIIIFCLVSSGLTAQAEADFEPTTINAYDPNSYAAESTTSLGLTTVLKPEGDQRSIPMQIGILPINLVDIEGDQTAHTIDLSTLEAGASLETATSTIFDDELWLNFTFRSVDYSNGNLYVYSNLPLPDGMQVTVNIVSSNLADGSYNTASFYSSVNVTNQGSNPASRLLYDFQNGYTGDGFGKGYLIKFDVQNPSSLPDGFEIYFEIL